MEKQFADFLIRNGNAKEEERELIEFGLKQGAISVFNWASVLIIGLLFGMFLETVVYSIAFTQLRKYVGGYHTRSQITCYFFSMFSIVLVLLAIKNQIYISFNNIILLSQSGVACIIIYVLAPIGDENKELDELEIKVYGRRGRITLLVEVILALVFMIISYDSYFYCLCLAFLTVSLSLVAAKINKMKRIYKPNGKKLY